MKQDKYEIVRMLMMGLLLAPAIVMGAGKNAQGDLSDASAAVPASALKADPWVVPPQDEAEMKVRLAELRKEYAPYLRSLPAKADVRKRQSLNGAWWNKVEVEDSPDGVIPAAPDWFAVGLDEKAAGWETVTVPHWRWSTKRDKTQNFPWYPESKIVWYRKSFSAETPSAGKRVYLCFAGVDWAAEVWLNGKRLGQHSRYWEPFRFEVTGILKKENVLAVRVIDGPGFGEPICQWSVFPFSPADKLVGKKQEYVMGQRDTTVFNLGESTAGGSGYGIHREVTLETVDDKHVTQIFARGYSSTEKAKIAVETDAGSAGKLTMEIALIPENFEGGKTVTVSRKLEVAPGAGRQEFEIAMPRARWWWPLKPCLYRCRVKLQDGKRLLDVKDTLFGFREARLVSEEKPQAGLQDGQFVLNGQPVFLRGLNMPSNPNLAWYWGETDRLLDLILLSKAGNFNFVRTHQHIAFPEVLELFDRLGILSQQEQGTGMQKADHTPTMQKLAEVVAPMAKVLYNHPGVVFFSFMNETHANMTKPVEAVLKEDPERLMVPIAGAIFSLDNKTNAGQLVSDFHNYDVWYGGLYHLWETSTPRKPGRNGVKEDFNDSNPKPPASFFPVMTPNRMVFCGEFGGEALDNYETMLNYPSHWGKTPALTDDVVWGFPVNVGWPLNTEYGMRGKKAKNLSDYIQSSQIHQADLLTEATKGFRFSPKSVMGYCLFHFIDLTPANWPKSVFGYDLSPKKGFFAMAQLNQPVVPLYRLMDRGNALEIWVSNDLELALPQCSVEWQIRAGERVLSGSMKGDIPAIDAVCLGNIDLKELPEGSDLLDLTLELKDAKGRKVSHYQHEIYRNFELMERSKRDMQMRRCRARTWNKPNLALNKPVVATSADATHPATNVVDGNHVTVWQAAENQLPQSLTVDLGESVKLRGARIMWPGVETGKVTMEISEDQSAWKPIADKIEVASEQWAGKPNPQRMHYFSFESKGRYVRVTLTAVPEGAPVGVAEVELY